MKRVGHYGVALAVIAPLAAWTAAAGLGEVAVLGGATVLALSMLPDVDERLPLVPHRGPTHSVTFAAVVGLAVAGVAEVLLPAAAIGLAPTVARGVWFGVGALAVLGHLLADALTPAGVPLCWPLSDRRFALGVCSAGSLSANWLLLALGVAVAALAALRVAPVY